MENAPEPAFIDELLGQRYRRNSPVIVPHHVWDAGFFDSLNHFEALRAIHRQGFFTQYHFAGFGGSDGNFPMHVIGAGDVNQVDVSARDELAPIGLRRFITPFGSEGFDFAAIASAN